MHEHPKKLLDDFNQAVCLNGSKFHGYEHSLDKNLKEMDEFQQDQLDTIKEQSLIIQKLKNEVSMKDTIIQSQQTKILKMNQKLQE